MLIDIDPSRRGTITEQIVRGVRRLVNERRLRQGTRLPSIRRFAATHGVSKFTVVQAYDRLVASGHLQSRPGAGFFVSEPARPAHPGQGVELPDKSAEVLWLMHRQSNDFDLKHLPGYGWLPPRWLEDCGLAPAMRRVSRACPRGSIGAYGDPLGFAPLREDVGRQLADIGIDATADRILLTNGITGAVDLVGRYLLRPDDVVLVDDPGYFRTFGHMRALGAAIKGVPWTATGPDLERLESIARTHSPRLYITAPIVQNPTGCSISRQTAFRVLQLAERYGFHIIEDDMFGAFHPNPPPRLGSLDGLNRVIYVNSFSNDLSPWLRVGYLAAHRNLVRDLVDLKMLTQGTSPELMERLVHEVLIHGQYRKHLARLHATLRQARDTALRGLEAIGLGPFGDGTHGLFAWMEVPGVTDTALLADAALGQGMLLAPGAMFRPDMRPSTRMRFNVCFCRTPETFRLLEALLISPASTRP